MISATFAADFSAFQRAAEEATTKLVSIQTNAGKVQSALDKMVSNFSGVKVIQDATLMAEAIDRIGGVSKLTSTELASVSAKAQEAAAKMRAMGVDVPEKLQSIADAGDHTGGVFNTLKSMVDNLGHSFVAHVAEGILLRDAIREVISVAKEAVTSAARLEDLSRATGISTDALQRMAYVGIEAGVDLETMARGVEQLSAKLAGGDKNATSAVQALGLNIHKLLAEGPKEAFIEITDAAGRVEDPMTKASIATELFGGRLAKQLLPLLGELKNKMDAVPKTAIISDENVKTAKEWADGLEHAKKNLEAMTVSFLGWVTTAAKYPRMLIPRSAGGLYGAEAGAGPSPIISPASSHDQTAAVEQVVTNAKLIENALNALRTNAMTPLSVEQRHQIEQLKEWGKGEAEIAKLVKAPEEAVHRFIDAQKQAAEYTKQWGKAFENLEPVLNSSAWTGSIESALKLGGSIHDLAVYYNVSEGVIRSHKDAMETWDKVVGVEAPRALAELNQHLGTLAGAIPQKFFDDTAKAIGEVQKLESGTRATGDFVGGIGQAAKPSMDLWYQGLHKNEQVIVRINDSLKDLPNILISAFTGGGGIAGAFNALGTTITSSLFGEKGPLKSITSGLSNAVGGALSKGLGKTIGGALGQAVGGVLPVIGGLVGPLIDLFSSIGGPSKDELAARDTFANFQKQFGSLKQTIDGVGAAYAKAGKTGVQAQTDLKRALDATHISAQAEAEALAVINGVLDSAKKDQDDLNAAIQRYGFSIQELGPAMQKQQLDQQAQQLLNDWRLLVGSGIELSTVNEHMASSINDYLKLARSTGQEVPEQFKGILQKLIDTGQLTDDAGNKITDLKDVGVTFATTMTEGFQKVVDKLQELIAKIPDLASSFANIPAVSVPVNFQYNYPSAPDFSQFGQNVGIPGASTGGAVILSGLQRFASGGDVVPIMAAPGEVILNDSQQKRILGLANGGGSVSNFSTAALEKRMRSVEAAINRLGDTMPLKIAGALASRRAA